jgi:hypothetical protein
MGTQRHYFGIKNTTGYALKVTGISYDKDQFGDPYVPDVSKWNPLAPNELATLILELQNDPEHIWITMYFKVEGVVSFSLRTDLKANMGAGFVQEWATADDKAPWPNIVRSSPANGFPPHDHPTILYTVGLSAAKPRRLRITVKTGEATGAGTDDFIAFQFNDSNYFCPTYEQRQDMFENGAIDTLEYANVMFNGPLDTIRLLLVSNAIFNDDDWYVDWVVVSDEQTGESWSAQINAWLKTGVAIRPEIAWRLFGSYKGVTKTLLEQSDLVQVYEATERSNPRLVTWTSSLANPAGYVLEKLVFFGRRAASPGELSITVVDGRLVKWTPQTGTGVLCRVSTAASGAGLEQVYEHSRDSQSLKKTLYKYDFDPLGDTKWGKGTPVFFAVKPIVPENSPVWKASNFDWMTSWFESNSGLFDSFKTLVESLDYGEFLVEEMASQLFQGIQAILTKAGFPPVTLASIGGTIEWGVGALSGTIEAGAIYSVRDSTIQNDPVMYTCLSPNLQTVAPSPITTAVGVTFGVWFTDGLAPLKGWAQVGNVSFDSIFGFGLGFAWGPQGEGIKTDTFENSPGGLTFSISVQNKFLPPSLSVGRSLPYISIYDDAAKALAAEGSVTQQLSEPEAG